MFFESFFELKRRSEAKDFEDFVRSVRKTKKHDKVDECLRDIKCAIDTRIAYLSDIHGFEAMSEAGFWCQIRDAIERLCR